jgi:AcrR family transcriptional regulator
VDDVDKRARGAVVTDTRTRIVEAGATLLWRQGYPGTGVKQIVAAASAPFGSVYHFFPGGKEELAVAAILWSGGAYGQLVDAYFGPPPSGGEQTGADEVVAALRAALAGAAEHLRESGFADACPIATVALEMSSTSEPIRRACAEVFEGWTGRLADRFAAAGIAAGPARALALTCLALLEGAFVLCRAARSTEALEAAGAAAETLARAALNNATVA